MAFCDEFALHTNFLKTHKQYVVNKYPVQEKEKLQQQKNLQPPPIVSNSPKRIDKKVENITHDPKVAERWNEMMEEFKETDRLCVRLCVCEKVRKGERERVCVLCILCVFVFVLERETDNVFVCV